MRISRRFVGLLAAVAVCFWTTAAGAVALTPGNGTPPSDAVSLIYDQTNGKLSMSSGGVIVTTFEVKSKSSLFDPTKIGPNVVGSPFDVVNSSKLFKLAAAGINSIDFGMVLPSGLKSDYLLGELEVNGSISPSGTLSRAPGGGPYLQVVGVPEPSSLVLACLGVLGSLNRRRK